MSASHPSLPRSDLLAAGGSLGGDGGDDNPRRRHLPLTHAIDANPGINPPLQCPVCRKEFSNPKALHGHMRCHPDRAWRGITPPVLRPESEKEVAASLVRLSGWEGACVKRYRCSQCGRDFDTRQALGGHRASHRSVKGCHAKSKYEGRNGNGDHGVRNGRPGGHPGKGGMQVKIGQRRRRGRWKIRGVEVETVKEVAAAETAKEMATDMVVQTAAAAAEVVAETVEEVAAMDAVPERRGHPLDLNLPAPLEDKNDDLSSGIIDLNKKLPGQDDE